MNTAEFNLYQRQWDIVPMDALKKAHVTIVGVGGLGSVVALALAKMGVGKLSLYDADRVEEHNFPNQMYGPSQLGMLKVEACASMLYSFTDYTESQLHAHNLEVDKDVTIHAPLVITCVDSMEARQEIWQAIKQSPAVEAIIDARAGAEELCFIYSLVSEQAAYEATLYDDADALPLPCTARAIIYTAFLAGGWIAALTKAHLTGKGGKFARHFVNVPMFQTLTL